MWSFNRGGGGGGGRVLRLFGRLKSLRQIMVSISASIVPGAVSLSLSHSLSLYLSLSVSLSLYLSPFLSHSLFKFLSFDLSSLPPSCTPPFFPLSFMRGQVYL
jgi:hypothetical protein